MDPKLIAAMAEIDAVLIKHVVLHNAPGAVDAELFPGERVERGE